MYRTSSSPYQLAFASGFAAGYLEKDMLFIAGMLATKMRAAILFLHYNPHLFM